MLDDASILADMVGRLRNESWFKMYSEPTIESLTKYLVTKLEERDPISHPEVCKYLTEINRKFRLSEELLEDISEPLGEEIAATDPKIILNNIILVNEFGIETYQIDCNIIEKLNDPNLPVSAA